MDPSTLRIIVNRIGVTYDALKTKIIYAEDLNDIRTILIQLEARIAALES